MTRGMGLIKVARLTRRQLIIFALASAALNGIVTASVGAWLGQTYAKYQARRQSIESLVHLVYERRTRAGMVASALRRNADLDEIRFRKRAYDEAYVEWNKNVMQNIFAIREVTGEHLRSNLEKHFEDELVASLSDVDRCLTKAYDARLANADPRPILEDCHMSDLHQFVLDCGATFTNELYKLSKLTFLPLLANPKEGRDVSERRVSEACRPPQFPSAAQAPPRTTASTTGGETAEKPATAPSSDQNALQPAGAPAPAAP